MKNRFQMESMKSIVVLLLFLSLWGLINAEASNNHDFPLPLDVADSKILPLRDLLDENLQQQLTVRLSRNPAWRKMIEEKKMAIGLVDLSNPSKVLFARVNGNHMMYAASLPKIAVLLGAFHCLENRLIPPDPKLTADLNLMIRKSDNRAATRVIERIGMERIQEILTLEQYAFYDETRDGGLWVGKKYAKTGKRIPDPIKGISHAATATQVCRFYYLLAMGKLVSREKSREMLEILFNPGISHKFVKTLQNIAPRAMLFRKSGTWKGWHSDSVLVWGPGWRRYIAVALIEDKNGESILRNLIPELEAVLKSL
jgi:beta-lactamase class A